MTAFVSKTIRLNEDQLSVLKLVIGLEIIKLNEEKRILEEDNNTVSYDYSSRDYHCRILNEIYSKLFHLSECEELPKTKARKRRSERQDIL